MGEQFAMGKADEIANDYFEETSDWAASSGIRLALRNVVRIYYADETERKGGEC